MGENLSTDRAARIELPLYSYEEADRIAGLRRGTAKRWLEGYEYRSITGEAVRRPPVDAGKDASRPAGVSFLDLIELVAIGRLRELGFSLPKVRRISEVCRELLGVAHPFAALSFKTDGRDIFIHRNGHLVDVLHRKGAQAWDEVLGPFLETLDYENELARRWWPLGRKKLIVVDPDYGFGLPVIAGSGVRTEIIRERYEAGDLHREIAEDFNLSEEEVERALQFEISRPAA